jgi:SAM-dependent methyltransferase
MLKHEAQWLGQRLARWPSDRGVVLNVGSSSGEFRTHVQPWIDEYLFAPARARGVELVHQDLFPASGVDIAGDLLSAECQARVAELKVFGVVCSSVLEHVTDRHEFTASLARLLPPGGRALITVPYRFPYHPDPIDTLFRPSPAELRALFPELRANKVELLRCGRLLDLVLAQPERVFRKPPSDPNARLMERRLADWLPYLLRSFKVACVELERPLA